MEPERLSQVLGELGLEQELIDIIELLTDEARERRSDAYEALTEYDETAALAWLN